MLRVVANLNVASNGRGATGVTLTHRVLSNFQYLCVTVPHTLRTTFTKRSAFVSMLHACSSFLNRDAVRTVRPFLRAVSSFPWTVRQQRIALTAAAREGPNDTNPVACLDGAYLLRTPGQGGQYVKIALLHHLYHDSPEDKMTRLGHSKTGLPMHINVSSVQPLLPPCIYVSKTTKNELPDLKEMFCATIPADPYYEPVVHGDPGDITASDLQKVYKFIILNRETLLVFWYQLDGCESYMADLKSIC